MKWFRLFAQPATSLTPKEILVAAQREADPSGVVDAASDAGRTIYERIRPRLRPDVRDIFESPRGAVGEIRLGTPNAFAVFAPPNGYVIRVYSGMPYLFHYVAQVLMTNGTIHSSADGPVDAPTRDTAEITEIIAKLMTALKNGQALAPPTGEGLSSEKLKMAACFAEAAEDFVVAHEFGHIAAWLDRGGDPGEIAPAEEYLADFNALRTVIGADANWSVQKRLDRRSAYAGAEFALRIFTSLEHLDYEFETTHPLPGGRLAKLRDSARQIFGSQRRFLEVSTMAFAWDQQLEAIEQRIAGEAKAKRFVLGLTADRLLSTFTVLIEEYVRQRASREFVINNFTALFDGVDSVLLEETARQLIALYITEGPNSANLRNIQLRFAEDAAFKSLLPQLPERLRLLLMKHWPAQSTTAPSQPVTKG